MQFDFATLQARQIYKLMASTITPRPIAWITSQDAQGRLNAAPFSFFNMFCADPPIIGVGIGSRPDSENSPKDTWGNIRATGGFVVQLVDEANAGAMNRTATPFATGESELALGGIETLASTHVAPPRIAASPVAFECVLHQEIALGSSALILGRVLMMHVRDDAVQDAERLHIATEGLGLIGRMHGAGWYARTSDLFKLDRITIEEWQAGRR
ncbi:flavin reductase family protein [Lichenicoccus sp.]|uniref:flavin reductase family protein n=1 Tax=Lichenicoccus sp. TaxID=2781899 RepID=UPI003D12A704